MLDVERTADTIKTIKLVGCVALLSPLVGFMAATQWGVTGFFLADGLIWTAAPWAFWLIVFKLVAFVRLRRFGPTAPAALGAIDLCVVVGATLIGPYLVLEFTPRAFASHDHVDMLLAAAGLFVCGIPLYKLLQVIRRP